MTNTYEVRADLPDRMDPILSQARASLDNINLAAGWWARGQLDRETAAPSIRESCEQVEEELTRLTRLVQFAVFSVEFPDQFNGSEYDEFRPLTVE